MTRVEQEAKAFVDKVWWPALHNAADGCGIEIARAVVAAIFHDAGETDEVTDLEMVAELTRIAQDAAAAGRRGVAILARDDVRNVSEPAWRCEGF